MKTQTVLLVAGASLVGLHLYGTWRRSQMVSANVTASAPPSKPQAQPARTASILPKRSNVTTAPVNVSKPLAVKGPSVAQQLLTAGAGAAANYGCSPLVGYQRDLCLQGANVGAGMLSTKFKF